MLGFYNFLLQTTNDDILNIVVGVINREPNENRLSYDAILIESTILASSKYFSKEMILNPLITELK